MVARLGSVVGAILAELGRARVVADQLTRDLVDQYRSDTILASMSVPRIVMDQVELTLRFTVADLQEPSAAPEASAPDDSVGRLWANNIATTVLPQLMTRRGLDSSERGEAMAVLVRAADSPTITIAHLFARAASDELAAPPAQEAAKAMLKRFRQLPANIAKKLGGAAAFERELSASLAEELPSWIARRGDAEMVRAALASRLDVSVQTSELPTDPLKVQELKMTLRGEDVSMILEAAAEA